MLESEKTSQGIDQDRCQAYSLIENNLDDLAEGINHEKTSSDSKTEQKSSTMADTSGQIGTKRASPSRSKQAL